MEVLPVMEHSGSVLVELTVTVKEQDAPTPLDTCTVVVPSGKKLPEAGMAVTVPQSPVVPGAG